MYYGKGKRDLADPAKLDTMIAYDPILVGARLRIVAPGAAADAERVDLVVARGAFGSGEHETTRSCLELLERRAPELAGAELLDLGSGTGILAIAALRLGASRATLVDLDPRAAACSREHLALNGLAGRARVALGELAAVAGERFDLLLANIHGDLLVRLAAALVACARPGASLVLSGILWEHNWDVRDRYERLGCVVEENRFLEEYSTLLLRAG